MSHDTSIDLFPCHRCFIPPLIESTFIYFLRYCLRFHTMISGGENKDYGFLKFHVLKILKILDSSISSEQFLIRKEKI